MGTDIHLYVEKRVHGAWKSADVWEPDEDDKTEPKALTVPYGKHFYDSRNYDVFAILADVRNGHGFAGVDTGDGFVPIAAPRGLPDDLSPELKREAERLVEHTPSWLLLDELLAYDWTRVTVQRGVVTAAQYWRWHSWRKGRELGPTDYCADAGGRDVHFVTPQQMEDLLKNLAEREGGRLQEDVVTENLAHIYTRVSWNEPYYRAASDFLAECMPRLWRLGKPADVRIVFWFDS